jgi:hypothetical protein
MIYSARDVNISGIFLSPALDPTIIQAINSLQIRYLVIDQRITQGPPLFGYYFEAWEQQVVPTRVPIPREVLLKFDRSPDVSRIYDNGFIQIYDVGRLHELP